jgi:hypothetical protein
MSVVETFLGFKKEPRVSKDSNKEPADVIRLLFLIVFASAYVYFPSSGSCCKEYSKTRTLAKAQVEFSPKPKRKLKSKYVKRCVRSESVLQKRHYLDEPMCQLVRNIRSSKVPRLSARKSALPRIVRSPIRMPLEEEKDVYVKEMIKWNKDTSTEDINPNRNNDSSADHLAMEPMKQVQFEELEAKEVVNPNEVMNPNSVKRLKSKSRPCKAVEKKQEKSSMPSFIVISDESEDQGENSENFIPPQPENLFPQQEQKREDNLREAVKRLQRQNQMLEMSVLDSQERIAEIRTKNDQLQASIAEKEDQLQLKDDLIMGLQLQMMNYESISGCTPNGDVDLDACMSEIRLKQKEELSRVKRMWLSSELQLEKRISKLVNALAQEKEHVKSLQVKAAGSEGQLESEQIHTGSFLNQDPGSPAKSPVDFGGSLASTHQMLMESRGSSTLPAFDVDSEMGNSLSGLQMLKERNRELELQLRMSDRTIGELSGEKRELEYLKEKLTMQLEQDSGKEKNNLSNTQSQQQAEPGQRDMMVEIPTRAPQPKKSKLFNVSKLLSCRKMDIDRNDNRSEKGRKRVITLSRTPELGQL